MAVGCVNYEVSYYESGWVMASFHGELTLEKAFQVEEVLEGLFTDGHRFILIDLADVTSMEMQVISAFVQLKRKLINGGVHGMYVQVGNKDIKHKLSYTHLDMFLKACDEFPADVQRELN